MKKKILITIIVVFFILGSLLIIRFLIGGDEDTWICQNGEWVKHGNPSREKPAASCGEEKEEKVLLSLPFNKNDLPSMLIPMGETLEHPKPDNPKGHPGIDFLWNSESGGRFSKIYASLDGEISAV